MPGIKLQSSLERLLVCMTVLGAICAVAVSKPTIAPVAKRQGFLFKRLLEVLRTIHAFPAMNERRRITIEFALIVLLIPVLDTTPN